MKTLDEVIKAFEWCITDEHDECDGCPYNTEKDTDCHERNLDALHYLKEYREMKEHLACLDSHTLHGDETERRYDNGNLERY